MIWPVYEFRPLPGFLGGQILRYAKGKWIEDDGEYDTCFINHSISLYFKPPFQRNIICSWLSTHWTGFIEGHPSGNPWHYALRPGTLEWGGDWKRDKHPNYLAGRAGMTEVCSKYSCANGRHVEMHANDKHIAARLLRDRETKEVFSFLEQLTCMYCGASAPIKCDDAASRSPQGTTTAGGD